jgi:glucose-fructose oxidoreductase
MDDDALAIINRTKPLVPGEEGLLDIRVVEGIFKSAELGGKEVTL